MTSGTARENDDGARPALPSRVQPGFFVDIEAEHPVDRSMTLGVHRRGWRGVNIVSDPETYRLFVALRGEDVNVNAVLVDRLERSEAGHRVPSATSGSTVGVPRLTLSQVLDRHGPEDGHISFLRLTAGPGTAAVLAGADWHRHRPEVIVVEIPGDGQGDHGSDRILLAAGYKIAYLDGARQMYCRTGDALDGAAELPTSNGEARKLRTPISRDPDLRADALGRDAEEARADLFAAEAELARLAEAAAAAEASLARSRAEAETFRAAAEAAEARCAVMGVELTRTRNAAALAQRREEEAEAALAEHERLRHLAADGSETPSEVPGDAAEDSQGELVHYRLAYDELANWKEAVRVSTSWRLTRPMRVVGRYLKKAYRVRTR